jgi:transposase
MLEIQLRETELDRLLIITQAHSGVLSQQEASERLGITTRQVRRLLVRVKSEGVLGIKSKYKGGNRLFSRDFKEQVLQTVRECYLGFGPTFASEKLKSCNDLKVNKETLRQWMMSADLWKGRSRKQARIHQSRERRARFGELVQIDGSHHDWFEGRAPTCCLLVFIDDATSQILGLLFDTSETTLGYMALVKQHVETYGRPIAYYSDKHSIFKTTREHSIDGRLQDTQRHRALRSLQIELICAHSSQAKGRVERANQTLQDRLVKELRLRGILTIKEANAYLPEFVKTYNERFSVPAANDENAHRNLHHDQATLKRILSVHTERKLSKNLEFSLNRKTYQITTPTTGYRLRHKIVTVCEHVDGSQEVTVDNKALTFKILPFKQAVREADTKELNVVMDQLVEEMVVANQARLPTGHTAQAQLS